MSANQTTVEAPIRPAAYAVPGAGRRAARSALAAAAVILVLVAGLATFLVLRVSEANSDGGTQSSKNAVIDAAVTTVENAFGYSYKNIDHDFAVAETGMAPALRAAYAAKAQQDAKATAVRIHEVVTASVDPKAGAAVVSDTGAKAQVLVFLDQTTSNTKLAAPRLDRSRVLVSLTNSGGKWLVTNFQGI
jgi:Mce-associated membrane protein